MIALIVAKAKNNVIGKDNRLIWHLPEDLKHFKALTTGHIIIMGRKTLESLPCKLPNREHWVVTRQEGYVPPYEGVRIFHSPEEALDAAQQVDDTVYCIGGAELYGAMLPMADRLYVTELEDSFDGDAFFPVIDETVFRKTAEEKRQPTADHGGFAFVTYDRIRR